MILDMGIVKNKVVACHIAKGSTSIHYWINPNDGYKAILKKGKAAINKLGKENIDKIYAIWLQGESDAIGKTPEDEYYRLLLQLKNDLKKDLFIDKFGIIKVGNFVYNEHDKHIQAAQERRN